MNSAGCRARSIAARISAMRLVTPVEVSLCTTHTALIWCARSAASFSSTCAGSTPCRQSPGTKSISSPSRAAICAPQRREMAGLEHQHPVARRQRVDQRRLPRAGAGRRVDRPPVSWSERRASCRRRPPSPSSTNSGPRWSIVGIAIACSTRSGTLVGPGICRKWRPLGRAGALLFIADARPARRYSAASRRGAVAAAAGSGVPVDRLLDRRGGLAGEVDMAAGRRNRSCRAAVRGSAGNAGGQSAPSARNAAWSPPNRPSSAPARRARRSRPSPSISRSI